MADSPGTIGAGSTVDPLNDGTVRSRIVRVATSVLDLLIVASAAALCVIALRGGAGRSGAAAPVLILLLLVPLRVTLRGRSWLADLTRTTIGHVTRAWALVGPGIRPAIIDSTFAVAVVLAAGVATAFLANLVLEPARPPGFSLPFANERFVQVFAAWDSGWYWDIATRGYYFRTDG